MIGRRALMEIRRGDLVNAGGGVPMSALFPVVEEEGVGGDFRWSVEHGVFGGRPLSSTHWNPTAITSPGWLLDFYDGGGLEPVVPRLRGGRSPRQRQRRPPR